LKIYFRQIYAQVGCTFPFNSVFQGFLSGKITDLIKPSSKFINLFGEDYKLIFNVSAKRELAINEIVGPKVYKKDRDVEHTIFLPYTPIMQQLEPNKSALEHLIIGACKILEDYEIDTSKLKLAQERIIDKIISSPEMFIQK